MSIPSKYELYKYYFKKEKFIYLNLCKCKMWDNFFDGEVWIPSSKLAVIQYNLGCQFST